MKSCIDWGTGGFTLDDFIFLRELIHRKNIRSILEYGCGISTELLMLLGVDILSLETRKEWVPPGANVILYTYPEFPKLDRRFDLAFIDGPGCEEFERAGKVPERKFSPIHAMQYTNLILLHDGGLGQIEVLLAGGFHQETEGFCGVGARDILFVRNE